MFLRQVNIEGEKHEKLLCPFKVMDIIFYGQSLTIVRNILVSKSRIITIIIFKGTAIINFMFIDLVHFQGLRLYYALFDDRITAAITFIRLDYKGS